MSMDKLIDDILEKLEENDVIKFEDLTLEGDKIEIRGNAGSLPKIEMKK
ncbi:MAG: hypothetical protein GF364_12385 [Candidatus Lokiarchaeota archaeon]|nr:hypothetical protein [Candidatus Lokiarchaeota archaeon]